MSPAGDTNPRDGAAWFAINVADGTSAHVSFSDVLFAQARWGDYSFAQVDPSGVGIWLATEYRKISRAGYRMCRGSHGWNALDQPVFAARLPLI